MRLVLVSVGMEMVRPVWYSRTDVLGSVSVGAGIVCGRRYSRTYAFVLVCVGMRMVRSVRCSPADTLGSVSVGLGIVSTARCSRTYATGLVCVGMGMLRGWQYPHTDVLGSVSVGSGILRSVWYPHTDVLGSVCVGTGIVRPVRYPRIDAFDVVSVGSGIGRLVCAGMRKGVPWPVWTGGPLWRKVCVALLVEDLPEQVGGGLGEGELAEARVDGREVGVDDLVEGAVLHGVVPFAAVPARLSGRSLLPLPPAADRLCVFSFLVLLLWLHRTSAGGVRACRARLFFCISVGLS